MGLGKTKALMRFIEENVEAGDRAIIVSFRKAFTSDAVQKYNQNLNHIKFVSYLDEVGKIDKSAIVQFESLHRIQNARNT
jgi:hypothetical protein